MPVQMRPLQLWLAPAAVGVATFAAFVVAPRDAFFLGLLLLPILLLAAVGLCISAIIVRRRVGLLASASASLAFATVLVPTLLFHGQDLRDRLRFEVWLQTHRQVERLAVGTTTKVIQHWEAWGYTGNENDNYLVSDPHDELMGASMTGHSLVMPEARWRVAERWRRAHGLSCDIVWVQQMERGFYIITTYECALQ